MQRQMVAETKSWANQHELLEVVGKMESEEEKIKELEKHWIKEIVSVDGIMDRTCAKRGVDRKGMERKRGGKRN